MTTRSCMALMKNLLATILLVFFGIFTNSCFEDRENEISAARSIHVISQMQRNHASMNRGKYAKNFDELIQTQNLDTRFSGENPVVKGYVYEMKVEEAVSEKSAFFSINADPQISEDNSKINLRRFYSDSEIKSIKYTEENRRANAADPLI